MSLTVGNICLDCHDAYALAQFWSQVLGQPMDPDDDAGAPEAGFDLPTGQALLFLQVPEAKTVKNRMHLCLEPDGSRDEEVDRMLAIGATIVDDRRRPDGKGWVVFADPEGNEFCVLRAAAERQAQPG